MEIWLQKQAGEEIASLHKCEVPFRPNGSQKSNRKANSICLGSKALVTWPKSPAP